MTTGDTSRVLGVSSTYVYKLEHELQPIRLENGQRRYDPRVVARVAKQRSASK